MPKTTTPGGKHAIAAAKAYNKAQKAKAKKNRDRRAAKEEG